MDFQSRFRNKMAVVSRNGDIHTMDGSKTGTLGPASGPARRAHPSTTMPKLGWDESQDQLQYGDTQPETGSQSNHGGAQYRNTDDLAAGDRDPNVNPHDRYSDETQYERQTHAYQSQASIGSLSPTAASTTEDEHDALSEANESVTGSSDGMMWMDGHASQQDSMNRGPATPRGRITAEALFALNRSLPYSSHSVPADLQERAQSLRNEYNVTGRPDSHDGAQPWISTSRTELSRPTEWVANMSDPHHAMPPHPAQFVDPSMLATMQAQLESQIQAMLELQQQQLDAESVASVSVTTTSTTAAKPSRAPSRVDHKHNRTPTKNPSRKLRAGTKKSDVSSPNRRRHGSFESDDEESQELSYDYDNYPRNRSTKQEKSHQQSPHTVLSSRNNAGSTPTGMQQFFPPQSSHVRNSQHGKRAGKASAHRKPKNQTPVSNVSRGYSRKPDQVRKPAVAVPTRRTPKRSTSQRNHYSSSPSVHDVSASLPARDTAPRGGRSRSQQHPRHPTPTHNGQQRQKPQRTPIQKPLRLRASPQKSPQQLSNQSSRRALQDAFDDELEAQIRAQDNVSSPISTKPAARRMPTREFNEHVWSRALLKDIAREEDDETWKHVPMTRFDHQVLENAARNKIYDVDIPFSKSRKVDFKPYTLKDFKELTPVKAGVLGPAKDTPEVAAARERIRAAREFAHNVRQDRARKLLNQSSVPLPKRRESHSPPKPTIHDKMKEFAATIPRPKPKPKPKPTPMNRKASRESFSGSDGSTANPPGHESTAGSYSPSAALTIDELERNHSQARSTAAEIRRALRA
jgi:Jhy protein